MIHFFDSDIAKQYGVNATVLLCHIAYWIKHNEANGTNYYDGNFWTYNSMRAFAELFPYMSERQISTAISKLIDDGVIITGNYNKSTYDRTLWYALTQKGKCIMQKCKMDSTEMSNGLCENVEPIPDNIPNNKPYNIPNNNYAENPQKRTRFTPPTVEEVAAYCKERNNSIDAQAFVDYYTANGWKVGKNQMKDWKAAVRNWERTEMQYKPGKTEKKKSMASFSADDLDALVNNF